MGHAGCEASGTMLRYFRRPSDWMVLHFGCARSRSGRRGCSSRKAGFPDGSCTLQVLTKVVRMATRRDTGGVVISDSSRRLPMRHVQGARGWAWPSGSGYPPRCACVFSCSLWRTPKRCSSSMTMQARGSLKRHILHGSGDGWPMTISTCPLASRSSTCFRMLARACS